MATSRPYKFYPREFSNLFLATKQTPVKIDCDDEIAAKNFRGQLYAFRNSLRVEDCGASEELILLSALVSFKLDGTTLIIYQRTARSNLEKAMKHVRSANIDLSSIEGVLSQVTADQSSSDGPTPGLPESVRQHNVDDS